MRGVLKKVGWIVCGNSFFFVASFYAARFMHAIHGETLAAKEFLGFVEVMLVTEFIMAGTLISLNILFGGRGGDNK